MGTLPFLLALVVMTRWGRNPYILFWGGMAVLAFVLALGDAVRPLNKLLFHLPIYNVFRAPSKHILEMSFALSMLAGFGISLLREGEKEKRFAAAVAAVLSLLVAISFIIFTFFPDAVRNIVQDGFTQMRHFQLRWDSGTVPAGALRVTDPAIYVPLITMSAFLFGILILLKARGKRLRDAALAAIYIIICAEAFLYKMGPLQETAAVENYNKGLYDVMLSSGNRGRTIFMSNRMLPLNAVTFGIRLVEGYHPLQTAAYQSMMPEMYTQPPAVWRSFFMNNALLSMLSVRYLVVEDIAGNLEEIQWPVSRDDKGRVFPVLPAERRADTGDGRPIYRLLASFGAFSVYENLVSLPRVYAVTRLRPVETTRELMRVLFSYRINPWLEAAVTAGDLYEIGNEGFSPGELEIVEERPDRISVSAHFRGRGFVVLADQFYPGWEAYVDGKRTKIYKTNGVLRGVVVPEGEHLLVFRYVPRLIYATMAASVLLLAALAFVLLKDGVLRKRERERVGD